MKISSKGRYAVTAMMDLALHDKIGPLTIADISEKQRISLSYLEQIFADLRGAGLVKGTRGPGGGYRLARSAEEISVSDIIGSLNENSSRKNMAEETYEPYRLWEKLSGRLFDYLQTVSLHECVQSAGEQDWAPSFSSQQETDEDDKGSQFAA